MFVITLRITDKSKAPPLMDGHNAWIKAGFDEGVFVFVGSLQQPHAGGVILALGTSLTDIEARIAQDPFVAEGVVNAEVLAVAPGQTDDRLVFLKG
jgi:uncharacterized protein YciI